jgi:hypothetical protein
MIKLGRIFILMVSQYILFQLLKPDYLSKNGYYDKNY